ncbi:hypothetical protein YC2023_094725 [Brassica napus]
MVLYIFRSGAVKVEELSEMEEEASEVAAGGVKVADEISFLKISWKTSASCMRILLKYSRKSSTSCMRILLKYSRKSSTSCMRSLLKYSKKSSQVFKTPNID